MRRVVCFAVAATGWLLIGSVAQDATSFGQEGRVERFAAAVADADPDVAVGALQGLRALGAEAVPAVPAITEALGNPDERVRAQAAAALAAIGPEAAEAAAALTSALEDESARVRTFAAFALGRIGHGPEAVIEGLVKAAFDTEPPVRRAALSALRRVDAPREAIAPVLEKILTESDTAVILPALQSMAEQVEEGVPQLREWLKKESIAYWGAVLAADLGPKAAPAVPELTALLEHEHPEMRLQALIALGEIGPDAAAAVPRILPVLEQEPLTGVRFGAAFALGKIGQTSEAINRALADAARDEDAMLQMLSLWALARLNPEEERVVRHSVEALVAGLTSEDPQLRAAAAHALADFQEHADVAGPALIQALKDADPQVIGTALRSLVALGPAAVNEVYEVLDTPELRHYATRVLYRMGPEAATAVPAIVEELTQQREPAGEDRRYRIELQLTLAAIGPEAAPAVQELIRSLQSDDPELRSTAAYALGKIGPAAAEAVPVLQQRLQDLEEAREIPLVWALLKIRPDDRQVATVAAPLLLGALDSDDARVRAEAAATFAQLDDLPRPVIDRLRQLTKDRDSDVRRAAEATLEQLEADPQP